MTTSQKGFTLVEIIVAVIIVGVLVAVAVPNYGSWVYSSQVQAVENNLRAMAAAQQKYYEDYGSYWSSNDFGDINSHLSLHLSAVNDGFTYACAAGTCTASNPSGPIMTVSVDTSGKITCYTGVLPNTITSCP